MARSTFLGLSTPEARKAQDAYIALFRNKMELTLHQHVYHVVIDVLDALGAAEQDKDGNKSVLDKAALELEDWETTFKEVDKILARQNRQHNNHRDQKKRVKVRDYLTDKKFENELYRRKEISGLVGQVVLGQPRSQKGREKMGGLFGP